MLELAIGSNNVIRMDIRVVNHADDANLRSLDEHRSGVYGAVA